MKAEVILKATVSTVIEIEYDDENELDAELDDAADRFYEHCTQDFDGYMVDADECTAQDYYEYREDSDRELKLQCNAANLVDALVAMIDDDRVSCLGDKRDIRDTIRRAIYS